MRHARGAFNEGGLVEEYALEGEASSTFDFTTGDKEVFPNSLHTEEWDSVAERRC